MKKLLRKEFFIFFKQSFIFAYKKDIFSNAMNLVYTTLLSIVPLLLFSFYILTSFNFMGNLDIIIDNLQEIIIENMAVGTGEVIINYIEEFLNESHINQLGIISFLSLVLIILFMLTRIEVTFNKIWNVKIHRDFLKRFVSFWTFITLITFLIAILIAFIVSIVLANLRDVFLISEIDRSLFSNIFSYILNYLVFILGYYLIPNTKVKFSSALFGGMIAGTSFLIAKNIYSVYTKSIVTYDQIYGALSFIPIFLIWLYLIWVIVLFGCIASYLFQNKNTILYINSKKFDKKIIESILPIYIIFKLYKNFNNEGSGLTFKNLHEKTNFPYEILEEQIKFLTKNNFISLTNNNNYVLTKSIKSINIYHILKLNDFERFENIKEIVLDKDFELIRIKLVQMLKLKLENITIKDIFSKK